MKHRSHSLHILFPLGLLGVFAALAVLVLLLTGAHFQESREASQLGRHSSSAASYLTEKLRQADFSGAVSLETLGDCDAIRLTTVTPSATYDTYLYCYDGSLRELMVNRAYPADPAAGRALIPLESLTLDRTSTGAVCLTCRDRSGGSATAFCALRSEEMP